METNLYIIIVTPTLSKGFHLGQRFHNPPFLSIGICVCIRCSMESVFSLGFIYFLCSKICYLPSLFAPPNPKKNEFPLQINTIVSATIRNKMVKVRRLGNELSVWFLELA